MTRIANCKNYRSDRWRNRKNKTKKTKKRKNERNMGENKMNRIYHFGPKYKPSLEPSLPLLSQRHYTANATNNNDQKCAKQKPKTKNNDTQFYYYAHEIESTSILSFMKILAESHAYTLVNIVCNTYTSSTIFLHVRAHPPFRSHRIRHKEKE